MKKLLLASLLAYSCSTQASDWSTQDTEREIAYSVLSTMDWAQTRYIASNPETQSEANRILGSHPSLNKVNAYFLLTNLLHLGVAYSLPKSYRVGFQYITIGMELNAVTANASLGIKMEF
jgi:hypothetical protein